jgi:hypothetical protein
MQDVWHLIPVKDLRQSITQFLIPNDQWEYNIQSDSDDYDSISKDDHESDDNYSSSMEDASNDQHSQSGSDNVNEYYQLHQEVDNLSNDDDSQDNNSDNSSKASDDESNHSGCGNSQISKQDEFDGDDCWDPIYIESFYKFNFALDISCFCCIEFSRNCLEMVSKIY